MQIKPSHPDTTICFDQIVHQSYQAILDYPTEVDDNPGIADLRNRFTPIRILSSTNRVNIFEPIGMLGQAQVIDSPLPSQGKHPH